GGFEDQGGDDRGLALAVAVDAAVALFDADQRPRDVVVDQVVALGVQVHALGGDVAGDQDADGGGLQFEAVDDLLLLHVGEAAVQHDDVLRLQAQGGRELFGEPLQGGDAFGEDHGAQVRLRADADLLQ